MNKQQVRILQEIKDSKWSAVNIEEDYKNLNSILRLLCPNGVAHSVSMNKFRQKSFRCECAKCTNEHYNVEVPSKVGFRVLGLDTSTHDTGFCVLEGNKIIVSGTKQITGRNAVKRIELMRQWTDSIIEQYGVDIVSMEDVFLGNNTQTLITLSKNLGVLENMLYRKKVDCIVIKANEWRAMLGIHGKNRVQYKQQAIGFCVARFGFKPETIDQAEAICIAVAASLKNEQNTKAF